MFLYYMLTLYSCVTIVVPQQVLVKNNLQEHESIVHFQETEQPQNNRNVQSESKIVSKQRTETPAQDSYLPLQSVNFEDQSLTPSGNNISQPSIELQPPSLGENGNVNYYSSSRSRQISTDLNRSGEESVVLSQQMVQITNSSQALINFGLNLLKNIDGKGKNVVLSPYSVATLLALLQQGALGSTQQQITQALQMTPQLSRDNFRKFSEEFQKRNSRNVLRVANNMFIADAFNLNPMFKRVAMRNFASEVTPIRFSQSEQAVRKINNWVATKTNDKIQEIVTTDSVGENTQIVLVNAVYFKGIWQVRFKPESTMPRPFHLNAGAGEVTKTVPFMRMRRIFKTGVDSVNKAQVIIIPFESEQYSIVVVLPSETTSLDTIVSTLTDSQLADYNKFSPKEVDLEIPKFTVRSDIALNQVLGKMGITNIFGDKAELMGVGNFRTFSPQVSSALHSAMLSIDEDGGTAGAATAFAVVALSYIDPSVVFRANRPFLAVLWDSQEGLPLFMARVEDPTV